MIPRECAVNLDLLRGVAERWREEADGYARDGALMSANALLRRVSDELTEQLDKGEWRSARQKSSDLRVVPPSLLPKVRGLVESR